MRPLTPWLLCAAVLLGGCSSLPQPSIAAKPAPRHAGHIYVDRPFQVIPEPEPFIEGVITAFSERLALAGYDVTGVTFDPDDQEAIREDLLRRNRVVPGTVGIHLTFIEAPVIIGFGTAYRSIRCTVFDALGQILLTGRLDPPERRSLKDLLLPRRQADVEGRSWGNATWDTNLSFFFPPRG